MKINHIIKNTVAKTRTLFGMPSPGERKVTIVVEPANNKDSDTKTDENNFDLRYVYTVNSGTPPRLFINGKERYNHDHDSLDKTDRNID